MKKARTFHIVSTLCILAVLAFGIFQYHTLNQKYAQLQFQQEQADASFSTAFALLYSGVFCSDPVDAESVKVYAAQVQVLLPLTSYKDISHLQDVADTMVYCANHLSETPQLSDSLTEQLAVLTMSLGKPLAKDIDSTCDAVWEELSNEIH